MGRVVGINKDQLDNIFMLFSLIVLADDKTLPEEIDMMGRQLSELSKQINEGIIYSAQMGRDWFLSNKTHLRAILKEPDRKKNIDICIRRLESIDASLKKKLIYAMKKIAWSDRHYLASEEEIIQRAETLWNV